MKVLLYYPEWGNRWIPYIEKELSRYELMVFNTPAGGQIDLEVLRSLSRKADVLISMWCDPVPAVWSNEFADKKIITYLRRYELWETVLMDNIKFENIDTVVFVSEYYRNKFEHLYPGKIRNSCVIRNGVDLSEFPFKKRSRGNKIGMMCSIKNVKNLPLAGLILKELPDEYKIHHIGIPFNSQIAGQIVSYLDNLGVLDRFIFEGTVSREEVPAWLDDKNYILSTSINEGNPNNIIEAMAMGIRPIIHDWPGARDQFPEEYIFQSVYQAVHAVKGGYISELYRKWVEEHFSLKNFEAIHDLIS